MIVGVESRTHTEDIRIIPLRAKEFRLQLQHNTRTWKLLKFGFYAQEAGLWIQFPYFLRESKGLLSILTHPGGQAEWTVDTTARAKTTSQLVKYSHHASGEAKFSQTGRVCNHIRRQSVPPSAGDGQLCVVQLQGLDYFAQELVFKPDPELSEERTDRSVTIGIDHVPEALRFSFHSYTRADIAARATESEVGPFVRAQRPDGSVEQAILVSGRTGAPAGDLCLVVAIGEMERYSRKAPTHIQLLGGLDPSSVVCDLTRPASALALAYPLEEYEDLTALVGSVDIRRPAVIDGLPLEDGQLPAWVQPLPNAVSWSAPRAGIT